jgi:hypothetical protein
LSVFYSTFKEPIMEKRYPMRTSTVNKSATSKNPPAQFKKPKPAVNIDGLDNLHDLTIRSLLSEPRLPPPKGCVDVLLEFSEAIVEDPDVPRESFYKLPETKFHFNMLHHEEILDRQPELHELNLIRLPSYSSVPLYEESNLPSIEFTKKMPSMQGEVAVTIGNVFNSDPLIPQCMRDFDFATNDQSSMEPQAGPSRALTLYEEYQRKTSSMATSEEFNRNFSFKESSARRMKNKRTMAPIDYGKKLSVQPKVAKVSTGWSY